MRFVKIFKGTDPQDLESQINKMIDAVVSNKGIFVDAKIAARETSYVVVCTFENNDPSVKSADAIPVTPTKVKPVLTNQ